MLLILNAKVEKNSGTTYDYSQKIGFDNIIYNKVNKTFA